MGFLKKLRDTTEKTVDKGAEISNKGAEVWTKAYDWTEEASEKGRDIAHKNNQSTASSLLLTENL